MKLEKNRVHNQETIQESVDRIPFLKRFFKEGATNIEVYEAANKYAGFDTMILQDYNGYWSFASPRVNRLLELAEARGDLT